ncbi:MAG: Sua5/YciO/YrdC/YwlC family protein, partial [Coriobacteriia bacterium]|nr:Sua5/YciO/YrdC/YwlC family protein [Coriobacteriia bacterium]
MSKVIHIDPDNPSAEAVNLAATVLREGGIVVFPTETVYGIGASATSCFGPQEIIDIKMRPENKPLPWLVEDENALDVYGVDVPEYAHRLAKAFWPGALTIV